MERTIPAPKCQALLYSFLFEFWLPASLRRFLLKEQIVRNRPLRWVSGAGSCNKQPLGSSGSGIQFSPIFLLSSRHLRWGSRATLLKETRLGIEARGGLINKNGCGQSSSNFSTGEGGSHSIVLDLAFVPVLFACVASPHSFLDQVLISRKSFCTEAPPPTVHGHLAPAAFALNNS